MTKIAGYEVHPAAELFPMMPPDELAELSQDIATHGLRHPIVLHEGKILDGRNRAKACKIASMPIRTSGWDGKGSAIDYVISTNARRRHLTEQQRIILAAKAMALFEAEAEERSRTNLRRGNHEVGPSGPRGPLGESERSRDQAAAAFGVSGRSVQRAKTLLEQAPEKAEAVLAGEIKSVKAAEAEVRHIEQVDRVRNEKPVEGKFSVIVTDFPWSFEKRAGDDTSRGHVQYPTMTEDEIAAYQLPAADDCIHFLWIPNAHLVDGTGARVLAAQGFTPKVPLTWVKTTKAGGDARQVKLGLGDWLRNATEHCILATRGRPVVTLSSQSTVLFAPSREHSRKPDEFYTLVDSLCPSPRKLEMFAREESRKGWVLTGAELGKFKAA